MQIKIVNCQYPDNAIIPILYKFVYKYESLDVKALSDKQIKDCISKSKLADFEVALSAIQKTGKLDIRDRQVSCS